MRIQKENAEINRKREEHDRQKRREDMDRRERMLEAAFEGDNETIESIIQEVSLTSIATQLCGGGGWGNRAWCENWNFTTISPHNPDTTPMDNATWSRSPRQNQYSRNGY